MNAQELLKNTRRELGLTQKSLATITGRKQQQIIDCENGRARVPGDLVIQLQEITKCSAPKATRGKVRLDDLYPAEAEGERA